MSKTYSLECSEEQLRLIANALDFYSRVGIGQFEELERVYSGPNDRNLELRDGLIICKNIAGHPTYGSHGIHNPKVRDEFRQSFDIRCVIRHRLAWDNNPDGGNGVDFYTPDQIGKLPLVTIKKVG